MYHELPRTARFWSVLLAIDHDLAETSRKNACPRGGRLHFANDLRKPRGMLVQLPEARCLRRVRSCQRHRSPADSAGFRP
jgi:hypothetical protein